MLMQIESLHTWNLSPQEAIALQRRLAQQLADVPLDWEALRTVAGVDVSVKGDTSQAAIVVLSFPELCVVETATARQPTPYPYIPGLLTFREGPVVLEALSRLRHEPDVFMFDGMGRIHPRRMGIAAHIGLWLQKPTLGCGKTHFIGHADEPGRQAGTISPLMDAEEVIGSVVRTRAGVRPVYISAGHLITLADAVALTLRCTTRYRLPEPIRAAHRAAGALP
jgi:deoxyribonuclease V